MRDHRQGEMLRLLSGDYSPSLREVQRQAVDECRVRPGPLGPSGPKIAEAVTDVCAVVGCDEGQRGGGGVPESDRPARNHSVISASSVCHQCIINASSARHQYIIITSQASNHLSSATVAISSAAGSHATSTTAPECPRSTASQDVSQPPPPLLQLVMRHRRMVLSAPPVAVRPRALSART